MSISFFTGSQGRVGGTERAVANVASMLVEKGFDVSILSLYDGRESDFSLSHGIRLCELFAKKPIALLGFLRALFRLKNYVKKHQPEVLVAVETLSFLYFIPLIFLRKRPKIVNWEHFNAEISLGLKSRSLARKYACLWADKIIVLSNRDKRIWTDSLYCPPDKIVTIYNINPFEALTVKSGRKSKAVSKSHIENMPRVLLAVGRLERQKGFDFLIEAWAQIPATVREGWELRIVGNGSEAFSLKNLSIELEVNESVLLKNATDCIEEEYKRADLFVLSSRFEGFGLVLIEAQSFDLPVVSFDCDAGPSEIISHAENGLLVEQENVPMLAQALAQLMQDDSLRLKMAANAQNYLYRFSEQVIADQWLDLLNDIGIKQN